MGRITLSDMSMEILMIGGTGVLSTAVTQEALRQGIHVVMINRGSRKSRILQGVELIIADKNDKKTIAAQLDNRKFDAVIDYLCYTDEETTKSFNFYSHYTTQYFFISSAEVYNKALGGVCDEEAPKVLASWDYSLNKWKSEERLRQLSAQTGIAYTIIRPSVTYGNTRIPYGIAPRYGYHWTFFARILAGKPILRWNEGKNHCNMTRVEDFAVAVIGLIGNKKAYNQAFNVCGDETPTYNELLKIMGDLVEKEVKIVDITTEYYCQQMPSRSGEISGRSYDTLNSNAKIKAIIPSFRQSITLKDGVKMTFDACKAENYQLGIDWTYDGECDRIALQWCKKNGIDSSPYHWGFVDYLGNATQADYREYYIAFHANRLDIQFLIFVKRALLKIKRLIKG